MAEQQHRAELSWYFVASFSAWYDLCLRISGVLQPRAANALPASQSGFPMQMQMRKEEWTKIDRAGFVVLPFAKWCVEEPAGQ